MAHKVKLVYAGEDGPGHEHIIEIWTDGIFTLAGHVTDAMLGTYSNDHNGAQPMRIEIVPNSPDMPEIISRTAAEEGKPDGD